MLAITLTNPPGGSDSKESTCNLGEVGSIPLSEKLESLFPESANQWVGTISQRRTWQPTAVFLPGDSPWTEEPGRLQSMGPQRVGQN